MEYGWNTKENVAIIWNTNILFSNKDKKMVDSANIMKKTVKCF